jgi:methanethiol oxidase
MLLKPDPTFYPSPKLASQAPPEKLAYVAALNGNGGAHHDALFVVDVGEQSGRYGTVVGQVNMPHPGDELHHFG